MPDQYKELICDLARPEYGAVIRSIVELAHGLGLTVVAEGVEDAATAAELGEIGCDALQGGKWRFSVRTVR